MANSKANVKRTLVDEILDFRASKAKQFGILRQAESVPTTQSSSRGASGKGGIVTTANLFLQTQGDSMVGPIGYTRQIMASGNIPNVGNNNTFDVGRTGNYTSHIIWGAGGSDQLDIIDGKSITGQHLIIETTESLTMTIFDESNVSGPPNGNIKTLDGNNLVLGPAKTLVWFVFSIADSFWHQVSNPVVGGGGTGVEPGDNVTWTGIHVFNGASFTVNSPIIQIGFDPADSLSLNAGIINNVNPLVDNTVKLGNATKRWQDIRSISLTSNTITAAVSLSSIGPTFLSGNVTLGDASSDVISVVGRIDNFGLIPVNDAQANLGVGSKRWFQIAGINLVCTNVTATGILAANGPVFLGNNSSDNITVTGRISSNFQPNADNSRAMGASSLRWALSFFNKIDISSGNSPALQVDSGSTSNEAIRIPNGGGLMRFDANAITLSATAGFQTLPAKPVAFIRVKVGGTERRIPYYAI